MSTIGIAGKFLTDEQMTKLSEVFTMTDPVVAMFQKMYQDEIEKKDFETAKKLLAENLDVDLIARTTNLSIDTIKDLQGL